MIIVAGHLEVDPADRDGFVAESAEAVRLARIADGCLDFAVSADSLDPARVNVYECWATAQALHAFRGGGPDDDMSRRIRSAHVAEHSVAD